MDKININYVIPMGLRCPTAFFLKQNGLKKTSYPFDWLKMYDLDVVLESLDDDFESFLDSSNYIDLENPYGRAKMPGCGHTSLTNSRDLFFHRDPRIPSDYDYFKRCIDRFRLVLEKDHPKLFFASSCFLLNNEDFYNSLIKLNNKLNEITSNFHIIGTHYLINSDLKRNVNIVENDKIKLLEFTINSGMNRKFSQLANKVDRQYEKKKILELYDFKLLDLK